MTDFDERLKDIAAIRSMMDRASRFLSLSGMAGISSGIVALIGAWTAWRTLADYRSEEGTGAVVGLLITLGLVVAGLSVGMAILFSVRHAHRMGRKVWGPTAKYVTVALTIPVLAGGVLCAILIMHETYWLLPAVMLLFYGMALLSAGNFTFGEIRYLGGLQILLGLAAAAVPSLGILFWAIGFGAAHVIYGIVLFRKYDRKESTLTSDH